MADSQRNLVHDMIVGSSHTANEIANVAGCSARSVKSIRSNIRTFGTARAPWNGGGRPRSITPPMLEAPREHPSRKARPTPRRDGGPPAGRIRSPPDGTHHQQNPKVDQMVEETMSSGSGRSKRRPPGHYPYNLPSYSSYQLVYADESGCGKRIGFRRTEWSPLRTTLVKVAQYQRESRF